MTTKILVVQVAALGSELLKSHGVSRIGALPWQEAKPCFPAVTCTFQADFRTATSCTSHGMIANGVFDRIHRKPHFWEQSARLVEGDRIWQQFRSRGHRVGMLFWQQILGETADLILSPAPIHRHHGGMIMDCYSYPSNFYKRLCRHVGSTFKLHHYWGPFASAKAGDWIAKATANLLGMEDIRPDLCFTYLPTLDYDLQRFGPSAPQAAKALKKLQNQCQLLETSADKNGYHLLFVGDYGIGASSTPMYPNQMLADAKLLATRQIKNMLYPDLYASKAFAMVDHEIAHVYVEKAARADTASLFNHHPSIDVVMEETNPKNASLHHPNCGELLLVAKPGSWFAYPWWHNNQHAPDYARHIDIHNKPGYDPCELFRGRNPMSVSLDAHRIKGSHGRQDRPIAWASNFLDDHAASVQEISLHLQECLNKIE